MNRPPLANLVAVASPDPAELRRVSDSMSQDDRLDESWSPASGWVAASSRFHGSSPDSDAVREAGLAFAQGRDEIENANLGWNEVARLLADRPGSLEDLPGDFGLIRFGSDGRTTVVRSAGGLIPFYVAGGGGRWAVTTTLDLMIRFGPADLRFDPLINAIWASGYDAAPGRRTFLGGVQILGRGEYASLGGGEPAFGRWWAPHERIAPQRSDEHPGRLRAALVGTLERELDPGEGNLLALSGGVDSSAIGALAAGTLGRTVDSLTVLPEDEPSRARDLRYIEELTEAVGIRNQRMERLDAERRLDLLEEPRVPFHVLQPYLCLLRSTTQDWPVTTLVGGEFADHTVGSTLTLRDWARHTSPLELWRSRSRLPTGRSDVRNWLAWRASAAIGRPPIPWPSELPELIHPDLRAEYADWYRERRRAAAADPSPLPYLRAFLERDGFLGMHWETTSALGVRRCFPFVTREVLELAFECHPAELVGPGTKRLLRVALKDDVPAFNLQRPDKGRPMPSQGVGPRQWSGEIPEGLNGVFRPGWPPSGKVQYSSVFRTRQLVRFAQACEETHSRRV